MKMPICPRPVTAVLPILVRGEFVGVLSKNKSNDMKDIKNDG